MAVPHPLADLGWNARVRALAPPDDRIGRIVRVDRGMVTVAAAAGRVRAAPADRQVTTGDWIAFDPGPPPRLVDVLPRWSALTRQDPGGAGATQLLAANIDLVLVAVGLDRGVNPRRLDRYVTLAWSAGAQPVVVLTKADAGVDPATAAATAGRHAVGADVVVTSSRHGTGMDELRALVVVGVTAVLVGESGAGKSTLVNALAGTDLAVAEVRAGDHKGRHTTRARELVPIPGGGVLLDTPGIRAVGLSADQDDGLEQAFADVIGLAAGCRFHDCAHDHEPACAAKEAVARGVLAPERLASFRALRHEVAVAARRADPAADRAHGRASGRAFRQIQEHQRRTRGGSSRET